MLTKRMFMMLIMAALIVAGMTGCATTQSNQAGKIPGGAYAGRVNDPEKPKSVFDRLAYANKRELQDFDHGQSVKLRKNSSDKVSSSIAHSPDMFDLAVLEGPPDYYRSFQNKRGQRVDEWIYEEKDQMFQFKKGVLCFNGPVDDQSKWVLEHGQPDKVIVSELSGGGQKLMFWYRSKWKMVTFNDGRLVVLQ